MTSGVMIEEVASVMDSGSTVDRVGGFVGEGGEEEG